MRCIPKVSYRSLVVAISVVMVFLVASSLGQAGGPPAIGIFLDNSGTMFSQIPREKMIANAIANSKPGSPLSLFGFAVAASNKPGGIRLAAGVQC